MNIELKYPFLSLRTTNGRHSEELKQAADRVIDSGRYLNGPETKCFEQELAASVDCAEPAVGVSNGLDALRLIFRGLIELGKLKRGDEVLVPANTYIASILPLTEFGLRALLVEPDNSDFCMSWESASVNITPQTRAMLVVHLYGNPCWNEQLRDLAIRHNLIVIEDNAQAIGAQAPVDGLNGNNFCGNLGDAAAFSFYPTKNIGALGDAGAVVTGNPDLANAIRALANYGSDRRYHNIYEGYNCRIDELQAAFLRIKLRHLSEEIAIRQEVANTYDSHICHPDIIKPKIYSDRVQVWHQYPIHVAGIDRDKFRKQLELLGIGTDVHYATPPHRQPCYDGKLGNEYPVTDRLAATEISLPIANISARDAQIIAELINSTFN